MENQVSLYTGRRDGEGVPHFDGWILRLRGWMLDRLRKGIKSYKLALAALGRQANIHDYTHMEGMQQ